MVSVHSQASYLGSVLANRYVHTSEDPEINQIWAQNKAKKARRLARGNLEETPHISDLNCHVSIAHRVFL